MLLWLLFSGRVGERTVWGGLRRTLVVVQIAALLATLPSGKIEVSGLQATVFFLLYLVFTYLCEEEKKMRILLGMLLWPMRNWAKKRVKGIRLVAALLKLCDAFFFTPT